ncbi:hypothetical protein BDQ17DRAFT_1439990 [Cyathus striatus]|nr:hypothetical protein BDQ17DRAFT_1439990 [Cyathus striatus]
MTGLRWLVGVWSTRGSEGIGFAGRTALLVHGFTQSLPDLRLLVLTNAKHRTIYGRNQEARAELAASFPHLHDINRAQLSNPSSESNHNHTLKVSIPRSSSSCLYDAACIALALVLEVEQWRKGVPLDQRTAFLILDKIRLLRV